MEGGVGFGGGLSRRVARETNSSVGIYPAEGRKGTVVYVYQRRERRVACVRGCPFCAGRSGIRRPDCSRPFRLPTNVMTEHELKGKLADCRAVADNLAQCEWKVLCLARPCFAHGGEASSNVGHLGPVVVLGGDTGLQVFHAAPFESRSDYCEQHCAVARGAFFLATRCGT